MPPSSDLLSLTSVIGGTVGSNPAPGVLSQLLKYKILEERQGGVTPEPDKVSTVHLADPLEHKLDHVQK